MQAALSAWQLWAVLSACCAALTAIFGKVGVEEINSNFATLLRTIFVLGVTAVIVLLSRGEQPLSSISRRTYVFLLLSALATGCSWLCYYRALKLGPASGVASIDKLSVVVVALFAVTFLSERLQIWNWLGIAMIAGGSVLVALR
jgi:bacterial/archaeal transporter family protein